MPPISDPLQKACGQAVAIYDAMLEPVSQIDFAKWLASLGILCAGNMTADDAKAKIGAYKTLMHPPRGVLTQESLDKAGRTFKWFPTYGEVAEFLDAEERELRNQMARAKQIRDWRPQNLKPAEPQPRVTPAEIDAIMAKHGLRKMPGSSGREVREDEAKPVRPMRNNLPEGPGERAARLEREQNVSRETPSPPSSSVEVTHG